MKFYFVPFFLILILSSINTHAGDTLYFKNVDVKENIISGDINGTEVILKTKLLYKSPFHNVDPSRIVIRMLIFDSNNKPVKAVDGTTFRKINNNQVSVSKEYFGDETEFNMFIPFYALDLPAGSNELKITFSAFVRDTSITCPLRQIGIAGIKSKKFTINKPETNKLKILVNGVRITDLDRRGNYWDWTGGLADIFYNIELRAGISTDIIFSSSVVKNATSAAWIDYSLVITLSKGDKLTLAFYDEDTMFHDKIGFKSFSYDDLMDISSNKKELNFDQVTYCIFDVKPQN